MHRLLHALLIVRLVRVEAKLVSLQRLTAREDLSTIRAHKLAGHWFPSQRLELHRGHNGSFVKSFVLPQDFLRTVVFAAHVASECLSHLAENGIGFVPLHVGRQGFPIGENVGAKLTLKLVVGEAFFRLATSTMNLPQMRSQFRNVVELVVAYLTFEIRRFC